jgi:Uma2 family endonuclease
MATASGAADAPVNPVGGAVAPSPTLQDAPATPAGPPAKGDGSSRVVLRGVSFATYRALRSELDRAGDRSRLTFDRGTLEIMVLSYEHEQGGYLLGRLIEAVAAGLRVPIVGAKSTTFSREGLARGIEADESYYIANEPRVRFHKAIDLAVDPPPDLAIEVDVSRSSVDKMAIYAALGVPEFWRFEDGALFMFRLGPEATYQAVEASVNLPSLTRGDVEGWIARRASMDQTSWFLAVFAWAQGELAGRGGDQPGR